MFIHGIVNCINCFSDAKSYTKKLFTTRCKGTTRTSIQPHCNFIFMTASQIGAHLTLIFVMPSQINPDCNVVFVTASQTSVYSILVFVMSSQITSIAMSYLWRRRKPAHISLSYLWWCRKSARPTTSHHIAMCCVSLSRWHYNVSTGKPHQNLS